MPLHKMGDANFFFLKSYMMGPPNLLLDLDLTSAPLGCKHKLVISK